MLYPLCHRLINACLKTFTVTGLDIDGNSPNYASIRVTVNGTVYRINNHFLVEQVNGNGVSCNSVTWIFSQTLKTIYPKGITNI
jgi:hypothetical protein